MRTHHWDMSWQSCCGTSHSCPSGAAALASGSQIRCGRRARRSVGCILAELLLRKPLFQGRDYIDQLKLIIRTLGTPSEEDLAFISSSRARAYIKALQTSRARPLSPCTPASRPPQMQVEATNRCKRILDSAALELRGWGCSHQQVQEGSWTVLHLSLGHTLQPFIHMLADLAAL